MNTPLALLQRRLQQQTAGPACPPVSGPSFPLAIRLLATGLVLALVAMSLMAWWRAASPFGAVDSSTEVIWLAAVAVVVASGYWGILTSQTRCDGVCIEQTWLWRKRVELSDITQVKLIHVPGLQWLLVPRLVVRSSFGLTTFQTGDPAVLARFRWLAHGVEDRVT